ncbi:hypothetical protein [Pseudovibrio brasiliensis]|uniref:Uncharacterized protein n=1 Tax=Pseudovibrio brasiliensis TaxID=1898042 RepID=A0ABX8ALW5_9HYPH|nr:hypothetical protein KGB56_00825 [Pseudovibrio brasiliensis]
MTEIINQAETLKANYGSSGASGRGINLTEINERMSGQRVDVFVGMLLQQAAKAKSILSGDGTDKREPVLVWGKA